MIILLAGLSILLATVLEVPEADILRQEGPGNCLALCLDLAFPGMVYRRINIPKWRLFS